MDGDGLDVNYYIDQDESTLPQNVQDFDVQDSGPSRRKKRLRRDEDSQHTTGTNNPKKRKTRNVADYARNQDKLSRLSRGSQAEIYANLQAIAFKDLSKLEVSEISLNDQSFLDTSAFDNLGDLDKFVLHFCKPVQPTTNGAPYLLVLAASALRALDLIRDLRHLPSTQKQSLQVAKLFSKHLKIDSQILELRKKSYFSAVGTPDRILKLLDEDALKLNQCEWLIIDTWKDIKGRWLLDNRETAQKAFETISHAKLHSRIQTGVCKIVFF